MAALLVVGLSLTTLGEVDGLRLVLALIAAGVGILAVALAAFLVSMQLAPPDLTLDEVVKRAAADDDRDPLARYFENNVTLLQGQADDLQDLKRRLDRAREAFDEKDAAYQELASDDQTDPDLVARAKTERRAKEVGLDVLRRVAASVRSLARFVDARARFLDQRWKLVALTVLATVALAGYAIASNPPKPGPSDFEAARLSGIDLSGTSLREAQFDGAELDNVDLTGANLQDADLDEAEFKDSTCPDGAESAAGRRGCEDHIHVPPSLKSALPSSIP